MKETDDEAKALDCKVQAIIEKASLFVRKVVVTDSVKLLIEKTRVNSLVFYPYIETLNKTFIIQAGQNSFAKENVFGTEPIRSLTLCMVKKQLFRSIASNYLPFSPKTQLTATSNNVRQQ